MDKHRIIIISLTVAIVFVVCEQIYFWARHMTVITAEKSATPTPVYQAQLPSQIVTHEQQLMTHQQQYMALVNQYELAKLQRQLLEEEVAIAAARQRIAELNQKTEQLATPKNSPIAVITNPPLTRVTTPAKKILPAIKTPMPIANDFSNLSRLPSHLFRAAHPSASAYTLDEILLLELPPSSYTIELKSGDNKKALMTFAHENALGENAIFYSLPHHHKNRYVLLYSYFNTKSEAQAVLNHLPSTLLSAARPRITTLTDIQHGIKAEK